MFKFNGGRGAIICDKCRKLIAEDVAYTPHNCRTVFCPKCKKEKTMIDKAKLLEWIAAKTDESQGLSDEANKTREANGYEDIDALEQYSWNEGILSVLMELRDMLNQE